MHYIISKTELYHHGILGMKWGKKNGPPYPLGASGSSASEKKAGWKKSLGGGRNESEYGKALKKKEGKSRLEQFKEKHQKKKEQKIHAKNVQSQMNQFQQNERDLLLMGSDYRERQVELFNKYTKAMKQQKFDKAKEYFDENEILKKKMGDIEVNYANNRTLANEYLKLMQKDKDIVYYVKETSSGWGKSYNEYYKSLGDKYGKTKYKAAPGVKSISGSKYVVKAATNRNQKKKKFNDPNKKREKDSVITRTQYVYY